MFHVKQFISYDVIVIGAGHAGVEAATMASRLGAKTALITFKKEFEIPIIKKAYKEIKAGAAQFAFALTIIASIKTIKIIGNENIRKIF